MGIQGLLQFIKDASEPVHVKKYKGQTVAVDTYCWLHKGAFACAEKLAKGEPTEQYVFYCMKFVDMLLSFGVKPILVFDGCNLPSKQDVDKSRRERRQANLQKGKQLLREGKLSEARDCFTRSVSVTPAMAHHVIQAARTRGVDCVVAPYEADAQLAFLSRSGMAQAIITEDSDLLAFGCQKVILKMDREGNGLEIDQRHLGRCRSLGDVFTEEKFRYMCILSGCDYLASLYGIGLGKACKLLKIANNPDIIKVIKKMGQYLKMSMEVPEEYIEGFVKANNTFLYQLVFDPVQRKVVPLNPYPDNLDPATLSYAGRNVGDEKGLQIALGNLDFHTMERIDNFNPDKPNTQAAQKPRSRSWNATPQASPARPSIWSRAYVPGSSAPPRPVAGSPERPPSTRGQQRVVSLQGLRLPARERPVKRPREDSSVSDQDVLHQYTSSSQKRPRSEEQPVSPGPATPSPATPSPAAPSPAASTRVRPRNCFATLLQRRNQDSEGEGQGTRSRFFSGPGDAVSPAGGDATTKKEESSGDNGLTGAPSRAAAESPAGLPEENPQAAETDEPEAPSVDTPSPTSPPASPPTTSPPAQPASRGLGVFRWSGASPATERCRTPTTSPGSGLAALQQFQRKKESFSWNATTQKPLRTPSPSTARPVELEDRDPLPDSPASQDSAYFSQSQPGLASCPKDHVPSSSPPHLEDATSEMKSGSDSHPDRSPTEADRKPATMKSKVAGLPRTRPGDQGKAIKLRPSGPARASGLRRKPPGPGGRATPGNENSPGLQATISGLWKNFGFKRENPRMDACKQGEPLSPVKDNLLAAKDLYC